MSNKACIGFAWVKDRGEALKTAMAYVESRMIPANGSMPIVLLAPFCLTMFTTAVSIIACRMSLNSFVATIEEHCTKKI